MAAPIKNNLPPQSQQWVRDMERRVAALELDNRVLNATVVKNATQIGSIQDALLSAHRAMPMVNSVEGGRTGAGSLTIQTSLDIPSTMEVFSLLAIATVTPVSESGGGGGSVVDGEGTLNVLVNGAPSGNSNIVVPRVTSDPLGAQSSTATATQTFSQSNYEVNQVSARLDARYMYGSLGGGGAALLIMVFPHRTESI